MAVLFPRRRTKHFCCRSVPSMRFFLCLYRAWLAQGYTMSASFALKSETPRGSSPEAIFSVKEVVLMRPLRVRFGRFSLTMPGEVTLFLLTKIVVVLQILLLHF